MSEKQTLAALLDEVRELRREVAALRRWREWDHFDAKDKETFKTYGDLLDEYRRRYADRDLAELGALLLSVREWMEEHQQELVRGRDDIEVYRPIAERELFRLNAERIAIRSLIDESRQNPKLVRHGPKMTEIRSAVETLAKREFSSRTELLRAVDKERGLGQEATYRFLHRRFGRRMPSEVSDFVAWVRALEDEG